METPDNFHNTCCSCASCNCACHTHARGNLLRVVDPVNGASLTLDLITRKVERAGKAMDLTLREFDLLAHLMRHAGEVCPRKEILEKVWHLAPDTNTNSVTEHIKRLRQAIDTGFEKKLIHTKRWKGYWIGE